VLITLTNSIHTFFSLNVILKNIGIYHLTFVKVYISNYENTFN